MTQDKKIEISEGSGNVFQDIGLPNGDEMFIKAKLVHRITTLIQARDLNQSQAAQILGIDQPKVSALVNGRLGGFSIERLIRFLKALGTQVDVVFIDTRLED